MGWKGRISSVPARPTPTEASGTAFRAPGRSPSCSEAINRVSSEAVLHLHIKPLTQCRNAGGEVSDRLLPFAGVTDSPLLVATVPLNFVIMANFSTKPMVRKTASKGSSVRPNVGARKEQGYGVVRSFNAFAVPARSGHHLSWWRGAGSADSGR